MLASEEASLDAASLRDLRSVTDLSLSKSHRPSHKVFDVQPNSFRVPPLAHDDGDERGGQSSFFRHSGFVRQPVWTSFAEGFAERFTEAQKSSQAMQHFLLKRTNSSTASSRPRPAPTQQTTKPKPATPEPRPPEGQRDRGRLCSARRYSFRKRQGSRPKIALDPAPQRSS